VTDQVETNRDEARGVVQIRFTNTGTGRNLTVEFLQSTIPTLLAELQKEVLPGAIVPIDAASLRPGASIQAQGFQIGPRGADALLTIFASLPDQGNRGVTIPMMVDRKGGEQLVRMLKQIFGL
jgi:hypothetical protein